ncbi:MAG: hypothetical protein ABIN83_01750 [Sphingomicrobium sp.]
MSASIRFLGLAVFTWAGVRAASLAFFPGATTIAPPAQAANLPPVAQTSFDPPPPPDPIPQAAYYGPPGPQVYGQPYGGYPGGYPVYAPAPRTIVVPASWPSRVSVPVQGANAQGWAGLMPTSQSVYYGSEPREPWPQYSSPPSAAPRRSGGIGAEATPAPAKPPRFDRLQLTAWALLRGTGRGIVPSTSLATGGTLGGSQAGARLTYRFSEALAASVRSSSSAGGVRGAEVAAGIRWQPLRWLPIAFTAERREGLGRFGGRSAFALFAEGGLYHRALFNKLYLDGYVQGGVVGARSRDLFVDGGATLTRPIWRNFSAGIGVWGAAQPGLYRLDAGPRLTMEVRRGIKVHADYRQRLVGNVAPPSGPAVTLAADF